jgi:hypothetical protein
MMLWSPVWIVALVLAVGAPWFARALADQFELRVRRRTQALVARARSAALHAAPGGVQTQAQAQVRKS